MAATATATDTRIQLAWLAEQDAAFALPRGRTKGTDADGIPTFPKGWQNSPHTLAEALAHAQRGGNVGLLTGKHSGGIVAIDVDRDYPAVVGSLGPFAHTAKIERDNAPERGKLLYRVDFPVKSQAWKPEGWKPADGEKASPWSELLSDNRQRHALIPPSEYDGGRYVLVDQHYGIAALTEDDFWYVWYKATEGRAGLPEPETENVANADVQPAQTPQATETKRTDSADFDAAKTIVLDAWTTLDVFKHHGKANEPVTERNGETRLLGNGGLLIEKDGKGWYCFGASTGGDAISAWGYCKRRALPLTGKAVWDTLREMAAAKGVTLPDQREKPPTNGALHLNVADPYTHADAAPEPGFWASLTFTIGEFLQRPKKPWLVQDVIGERDINLFYGPSGNGKTHVTLDLAFSCATGRTFAGRFAVARPCTVVYATGEGVSGLADRLRAVSTYYDALDAPIYILTDTPQLFQRTQPNGALPFLEQWRQMAETGRVPATVDLLIIDTLHNATAGADENSAKDAGITLETLRALRAALECAVLLNHHAAKNGNGERGSSALRAACDTVVRVEKSGSAFTMSYEKLKDGSGWPVQQFELVAVGDSVRVEWTGTGTATENTGNKAQDKQHLLEVMVKHTGMKFTASSLAEAIGKGENHTRNLLAEMERGGQCLRELSDPTRGQSSRNPWVYYCKPFTSHTGQHHHTL